MGRFILVGASHAARLQEVMTGLNMQATTLGTSYWYPTKKNCTKMADDLKEMLDGLDLDQQRETVEVFNTMDKSYFLARGGGRELHPAQTA
jgi:hypothetical protein